MYNKICYLPSAVLALFCTLSIGAIVGSETLAQTAENAATVITPAPVIHLADNLDEADGLGWCIDTVGRGFNTALQVHSCKPQGATCSFPLTLELANSGQLPLMDTACPRRPPWPPIWG